MVLSRSQCDILIWQSAYKLPTGVHALKIRPDKATDVDVLEIRLDKA